MTREDFKVIPKFYATNALTYILYDNTVIGFAEVWNNFGYDDDGKSTKTKRPQAQVTAECESIIKRYISRSK